MIKQKLVKKPAIANASVSRESLAVECILSSGLFDLDFYRKQCGDFPDLEAAVRHYVHQGEADNHCPSKSFNPIFFRSVYGSEAEQSANLFFYYIENSQTRKLYTNRKSLSFAVEELLTYAPGLVADTSRARSLDPTSLTLAEKHLASGWVSGDRLDPAFDDIFYANVYGEYCGKIPPIVHYYKYGLEKKFLRSAAEMCHVAQIIESEFDEEFYLTQNPKLQPSLSPLEHYVTVGWRQGFLPTKNFSTQYYLDRSPDIDTSALEPFGHYIAYGRDEGRQGQCDVDYVLSETKLGRKEFDFDRQTIMVVVHEASFSGAPILGLEIGRILSKKYNVIFYSLKAGALIEEFEKFSVLTCVSVSHDVHHMRTILRYCVKSYGLSCIIANSVETVDVAEAALQEDVPCVALVHEFAEYTLPVGKMSRMTSAADFTLFPARIIEKSAQKESVRIFNYPSEARSVSVQGKVEISFTDDNAGLSLAQIEKLLRIDPLSRPKIVLGAGHVQARKGVDLFIQTAAQMLIDYPDIRFVWVGAGYEPVHDIGYSVWLKNTIDRAGLEQVVTFIPHQPNLDVLLQLCDVFFVSSRLDPFPNVAIDAIAAGRRVVCFDDATGVAEVIADGLVDGAVAEYANVADAAKVIKDLLKLPSHSEKNVQAASKHFSIIEYVEKLEEIVTRAKLDRAAIKTLATELAASDNFDAEFYTASGRAFVRSNDAIREYASRAHKGLVGRSAKPGYNEGVLREQQERSTSPKNDLRKMLSPTHQHIAIDEQEPSMSLLRIALHIHLHYADLADEFARMLAGLKESVYLYITITDVKHLNSVKKSFEDLNLTVSEIDVVPNRGRDISPLIFLMKKYDLQSKFDVLGHFHGKKSEFAGPVIGPSWRRFLTDTLAGDAYNLSRIIGVFERDSQIGLLFPEDRHSVGWSGNRAFAESVADALKLKSPLPKFPVFPIGTMFWCRPEILKAAVDHWNDEIVPEEPLGDDGTILHAFERLLPSMCEASGRTWATVRRLGVNRVY